MGRCPRRRINGTQKWRTGLPGYSAETNPGGLYLVRLNSSYPKRERNKILLPRSKRGGQQNPTSEKVTQWIKLLHKHPAHLHALDIKDAQKQRDPGIKPLEGMTRPNLQTNTLSNETRYETKSPFCAATVRLGSSFSSIK